MISAKWMVINSPLLMIITFIVVAINSVVLAQDGKQTIREQMCDLPVKELKKNADNAMMNREYDEALEIFSLLTEKEPNVERHLYKKSQVYEKLKKYRNALQDLTKLLEEINPKSTNALNLRARVFIQMGWCDEAVDDYKEVLRIKPSHGDAKKKLPQARQCMDDMNLVQIRMKENNHQEVERILDELINSHGKSLHFLFLRAESRFRQEKYYEAIADLGSLLKESPQETDALFFRASAYYMLREYDAVKMHIKEIMKYDPEHAEARELNKKISSFQKLTKNARIAIQEGNFEQALMFFEEAVQVDTDHKTQILEVYSEICEVYIEAKNTEEASRYCEAAMSVSHDRALEVCTKYANFQLNHCHTEEDYEMNTRIWHKCRELNDNQDSHEIREGMQRNSVQHKRFRQKDRDYYGILGVPRDASSGEIKKKYRKLAKEMHPDRFVGAPEDEQKEAERKFHRIAQAYEVLSSDDLRSRYDRGEDVENPNQQQQQQRGFHGFPFAFQRGGQTFNFRF